MKILVTGGAGYKGSVLVPLLLKDGYEVISLDTNWFGNFLKPHPKLTCIKEDIRNLDIRYLKGIDSVIHLANIANDPAVDLRSTLSWEVNVLAGYQLIDKSIRAKVKQFLYASSGSVYGIKSEEKVTENLELVPISLTIKPKCVLKGYFYLLRIILMLNV